MCYRFFVLFDLVLPSEKFETIGNISWYKSMPFWLLNLSESDRLICIPVRYLGKCTHLRKTPQILLSATLWINQLSILSSITQTYIHMFLHHLTCFPATHVLAVFISFHHHQSPKKGKTCECCPCHSLFKGHYECWD